MNQHEVERHGGVEETSRRSLDLRSEACICLQPDSSSGRGRLGVIPDWAEAVRAVEVNPPPIPRSMWV